MPLPKTSSAELGARDERSVRLSGAIPAQLGRYTVLGRLASGGMASVYVGRQVGAAGFERLVAIKCCHEHLRTNEAFASMFLEEARLAARIRHPNVVATFDVSDGDPLYLVMEYVEGESLSAFVRRVGGRGGRMPLEVSLRIMMDALAGLQAAHECRGADGHPLGLVHCDVSPQNILVGVDGTSRITDFGIARAAAQLTDDRTLIEGKLAYMAPEQLSSAPITQRTDVFAAGVVLWELLTGQALFCGDTDAATVRAALLRRIPPPSSIDPSLARPLDAVVLGALERDPQRRFQSAGDFLTALEGLPIVAATARAVGEYVRREVGAGVLASQWESGAFRKGTVSDPLTTGVASAALPLGEAPTRIHGPQEEQPTRLVAPPADLVAATSPRSESIAPRPPERAAPSLPEAYRARRLIVAIALILLGCGAGLLLTAPSKTPGQPVSAPPGSSIPSRGP